MLVHVNRIAQEWLLQTLITSGALSKSIIEEFWSTKNHPEDPQSRQRGQYVSPLSLENRATIYESASA
jgi:hypothetical protein